MGDWWSYGLADFLLFSPRTYLRLIEIHNRALWPWHVLALVTGVLVAVLVLRRDRPAWRLLTVVLALGWLWVSWAWLLGRYATINWAAGYLAVAFVAEAMLLLVMGSAGHGAWAPAWSRWFGLALVLFGLVVHPAAAMLSGRGWWQMELFGIMPDPTAVVTLGVLLGRRGWLARLALAVPLLWCGLAGATLLAMDEAQALVLLATGLLALAAAAADMVHGARAAGTT